MFRIDGKPIDQLSLDQLGALVEHIAYELQIRERAGCADIYSAPATLDKLRDAAEALRRSFGK